jgi:hypothetical protein
VSGAFFVSSDFGNYELRGTNDDALKLFERLRRDAIFFPTPGPSPLAGRGELLRGLILGFRCAPPQAIACRRFAARIELAGGFLFIVAG